MITRKSRGMLQLVSRDIRNVFSHNYRKLSGRQSRYFNGQVVKTQLASIRQNFKVCNMPKLSLAKCCKVLQEIATIQKSKTKSPLNQRHKSKTLKWVRKYKKMHFSNVIFINKCHATLVESDKWAKCWISSHHCPPVRVRHQQGEQGSCSG